MSLLEVMSYGNCCLVSDITECTEAVGGHALTFRTGEEGDLSEKLLKLNREPDTVAALRAAAREQMSRAYHWDDVTEKTLELYQ